MWKPEINVGCLLQVLYTFFLVSLLNLELVFDYAGWPAPVPPSPKTSVPSFFSFNMVQCVEPRSWVLHRKHFTDCAIAQYQRQFINLNIEFGLN